MNIKKKFLSMILIAALIVTSFTGFAGNTRVHAAESDGEITVYVSISDKGDVVVRQQSVEVTDVDDDGALTIADALYCAHEKYYKGGAAAGYAAEEGQYGLGLTKLWGDESFNFGYYVNDNMAWSLTDPIADRDYVTAWIYKQMIFNEDGSMTLDAYSFFNTRVYSAKKGATKKLSLSYYVYDENWNLVAQPAKNAVITIGNKPTEITTSKKGKFSLSFNKSGSYFVSAFNENDDPVLVPPTLVIFIQPDKGEVIEVKNKKYTVTKNGKVKTDKKGKVTFSKSANNGKSAPKTIEYAGVTYKVKVVD